MNFIFGGGVYAYKTSFFHDILKSLFSKRSDRSPKFCLLLGNSNKKVGEYTILDMTPKKEVK